MKIAVTDACIFIDIHDLKLTPMFFSLPFEVHTTMDVYNELFDEHKDFLTAFISVGKFHLHILTEEQRNKMHSIDYPKSLSENDKTVLYVAEEIDAILLSSDKVVRNTAKIKAIEYHGMLWIFDQFISSGLLLPTSAISKMEELMTRNIIYRNNRELVHEISKRFRNWAKS